MELSEKYHQETGKYKHDTSKIEYVVDQEYIEWLEKQAEVNTELLEALQAMYSRFKNTEQGMMKADYVKDLALNALRNAGIELE